MISSTITVRTIKTFQELENLRTVWESWQDHPNVDFDFFQLICQVRSEVNCPHVTVLERDGQPRALLVARCENTRFFPKIGYLKPIQIPATVITVLHQGLLGSFDEEVAEKLVRHLWSVLSSGEADAIVFYQVPEYSPIARALLFHGPRWWCDKRVAWSNHWVMVLPECFDFIQEKLGSKQRWKIRKRQRELETAFPERVSWQWIRSIDDVPDICKRIEEVSSRTYQRGLGAGFIDDEEHRRRFSLFANRGQLRMQLLEVDNKVRAFWIGEIYNGVFHSSFLGYDPDFRQYEPGTLVFVRLVGELEREGVRKIDFGLGDGIYKQRYGDECWREATIKLFAPTINGLALRSVFGIFGFFDRVGRYMLQKVGMLDRLKTGWRRRLESSKLETIEE